MESIRHSFIVSLLLIYSSTLDNMMTSNHSSTSQLGVVLKLTSVPI